MDNTEKTRVCRNKKCQKILPIGYKHKYCESCRNQHVKIVKDGLKNAGKIATAVGGIAVVVVTKGKVNPKE